MTRRPPCDLPHPLIRFAATCEQPVGHGGDHACTFTIEHAVSGIVEKWRLRWRLIDMDLDPADPRFIEATVTA